MTDEYVQAMLALWTQEKPEFEGKYVSFRDVGYEPKPQNLPLWFGGDAEAPLKRIVKWGDGWSTFLTPPEKFPEALDFIHSKPASHGRPIELFFHIEVMKLDVGHVVNTAAAETIGTWRVKAPIELCGSREEVG